MKALHCAKKYKKASGAGWPLQVPMYVHGPFIHVSMNTTYQNVIPIESKDGLADRFVLATLKSTGNLTCP